MFKCYSQVCSARPVYHPNFSFSMWLISSGAGSRIRTDDLQEDSVVRPPTPRLSPSGNQRRLLTTQPSAPGYKHQILTVRKSSHTWGSATAMQRVLSHPKPVDSLINFTSFRAVLRVLNLVRQLRGVFRSPSNSIEA